MSYIDLNMHLPATTKLWWLKGNWGKLKIIQKELDGLVISYMDMKMYLIREKKNTQYDLIDYFRPQAILRQKMHAKWNKINESQPLCREKNKVIDHTFVLVL